MYAISRSHVHKLCRCTTVLCNTQSPLATTATPTPAVTKTPTAASPTTTTTGTLCCGVDFASSSDGISCANGLDSDCPKGQQCFADSSCISTATTATPAGTMRLIKMLLILTHICCTFTHNRFAMRVLVVELCMTFWHYNDKVKHLALVIAILMQTLCNILCYWELTATQCQRSYFINAV
jgi:hypothetical protein